MPLLLPFPIAAMLTLAATSGGVRASFFPHPGATMNVYRPLSAYCATGCTAPPVVVVAGESLCQRCADAMGAA